MAAQTRRHRGQPGQFRRGLHRRGLNGALKVQAVGAAGRDAPFQGHFAAQQLGRGAGHAETLLTEVHPPARVLQGRQAGVDAQLIARQLHAALDLGRLGTHQGDLQLQAQLGRTGGLGLRQHARGPLIDGRGLHIAQKVLCRTPGLQVQHQGHGRVHPVHRSTGAQNLCPHQTGPNVAEVHALARHAQAGVQPRGLRPGRMARLFGHHDKRAIAPVTGDAKLPLGLGSVERELGQVALHANGHVLQTATAHGALEVAARGRSHGGGQIGVQLIGTRLGHAGGQVQRPMALGQVLPASPPAALQLGFEVGRAQGQGRQAQLQAVLDLLPAQSGLQLLHAPFRLFKQAREHHLTALDHHIGAAARFGGLQLNRGAPHAGPARCVSIARRRRLQAWLQPQAFQTGRDLVAGGLLERALPAGPHVLNAALWRQAQELPVQRQSQWRTAGHRRHEPQIQLGCAEVAARDDPARQPVEQQGQHGLGFLGRFGPTGRCSGQRSGGWRRRCGGGRWGLCSSGCMRVGCVAQHQLHIAGRPGLALACGEAHPLQPQGQRLRFLAHQQATLKSLKTHRLGHARPAQAHFSQGHIGRGTPHPSAVDIHPQPGRALATHQFNGQVHVWAQGVHIGVWQLSVELAHPLPPVGSADEQAVAKAAAQAGALAQLGRQRGVQPEVVPAQAVAQHEVHVLQHQGRCTPPLIHPTQLAGADRKLTLCQQPIRGRLPPDHLLGVLVVQRQAPHPNASGRIPADLQGRTLDQQLLEAQLQAEQGLQRQGG